MKTTLWNILSNKVNEFEIPNGISIPKIQRDYAQGRNTLRAKEIRNEFLKNIHDAILDVKNSQGNALDLDFVYGSKELGSFIPLDGQQRLTTLFLLHWYLAFKANNLSGYTTVLSKFRYETRPTSNLFIKALCKEFGVEEYKKIFGEDNANENNTFKNIIENEHWYFSSWSFDNTISSMINMLDSIHSIFKDSDIVIDDLIQEDKPSITFNFLQLETYGLSDGLYIKMNARGKQLTSFENLKAQISKLIKEGGFNEKYNYSLVTSSGEKAVDVETYFATKIDTIWSDYFWKLKGDEYSFDNKLLNLLTFIGLNELIRLDIDLYDKAISQLEKVENISYYTLKEVGLLNESSIIKYIDTLDVICSNQQDVVSFFENSQFKDEVFIPILTDKVRPVYERRVLFAGTFDFLIKNIANPDFHELQKWSRLLFNLTNNTIYNRSKDFQDSLDGIKDFLNCYNGDVYATYLAQGIKGFDTVQTLEEEIKITLRKKYSDFNSPIDQIENDAYLAGQISCILKFSGIYDSYLISQFNNYTSGEFESLKESLDNSYKKFKLCFDDNGLKAFEQEEFRRALLSIDEFYIYSTNFFFYNNSTSRDLSWKRLLKEVVNLGKTYRVGAAALTLLFNHINLNSPIQKQLEAIINDYIKITETKDWKYYFIKYPLLFQSSKQHYVKFFENIEDDEYVYCLNKTKYNKEVDYDFMSLVVKSTLISNGLDVSKIEYAYQHKYNQFGINSIKGKSVKIIYNTPKQRHKFTIKVYGQDEFYEKSFSKVTNFIIDNYYS
ncbi:DUF262 domain-containing protein [Sphingobacterium bovisgrunnientis]|uniref:DUF262 domain-containing protein n=1 Tax=Sphingobacterium bovisgrunnientis TaxID=1874697 RepID=UPI00135C2B35|nr:DUF262 domain-containing protein [Sphingobacterium bovisgrunnientis]